MREYKSVRTQPDKIDTVANLEAQQDWRLCAVLPFRYLPTPVIGTPGLELSELVVIFEREAS
jgi:hypothetical protein